MRLSNFPKFTDLVSGINTYIRLELGTQIRQERKLKLRSKIRQEDKMKFRIVV